MIICIYICEFTCIYTYILYFVQCCWVFAMFVWIWWGLERDEIFNLKGMMFNDHASILRSPKLRARKQQDVCMWCDVMLCDAMWCALSWHDDMTSSIQVKGYKHVNIMFGMVSMFMFNTKEGIINNRLNVGWRWYHNHHNHRWTIILGFTVSNSKCYMRPICFEPL